MLKKHPLLVAGAAAAEVTITLAILWNRALNLPSVPVAIKFVGSGKFDNNGTLRFGPTFWVTNHTARALCVTPWTVEVRQGVNWAKWQYRGPGLFIAPHAAAYQTIDFAPQPHPPPTNTWRLTFNVAERLAGPSALLLKIKHYPRWLRQRSNTNLISMPNPFTKGAIWYGNPRKVLSEEVLQPQEGIPKQ